MLWSALNTVRQPAEWLASTNCCGVRLTVVGKTCGVSLLPTEPAISMPTPPYRCSSAYRNQYGQSALSHSLS